jgi:probable rRNA maturation factor
MPSQKINFYTEDVDFTLKDKGLTRDWIKVVVEKENFRLKELNYIFCSDEYLLKVNQEYLDHDTYTDIITFDNSEEEKTVEGDIFVSIERIKENASKYKTPFHHEMNRVLIHGVLHLLGYKDKSEKETALMRNKEDTYLSLFDN